MSRVPWGAKVIDRLAADLRREFPEMTGLGRANLHYMRAFADAWPADVVPIVQRPVGQLPWGHNITLLTKLKDREARLWYAHKAIEHGWSRPVLEAQIATRLRDRRGNAISSFEHALPPPDSELVRDAIKDPYHFEFLGLGSEAKERDLELALLRDVESFLMEMGRGFALVGRQWPLRIPDADGGADSEFFIDLLFFNYLLNRFVVIDLKVENFKPEFAGKMNFYLNALDMLERQPGQEESIGLILCPGRELRRVGGSGEAVAAIDATFSAPKSVSSVWALAGPDLRAEIEHAHETAIDRALAHATRQVPMLRRRVSQDTVIHEKATGLIATSWRHTTARAVDDQVPDPQLHSHVLLHGAIRRDGQVVAIDSRAWLVHQREIGAAYRTELARELTAIGFAVRRGTGRGARYFELDGIPGPLIDRWSSRHHQVQAAIRDRLTDQEHALETAITAGGPAAIDAVRQLQVLRESRQLSPKQERMMGAATRSEKVPVTIHDLDDAWQQTARSHRLTRERVEVLRHQARAPLPLAAPNEVLAGLTEFDATFPARDARAVALEQSTGAPINAALERLRKLRASEEILVVADGNGTTRSHRGRERTVVAITQRLTATQLAPLPAGAAEREADRLDTELSIRGGGLSDEQRAAIHLACGPRPLVLSEGQAGTGKSTALTGIARAHQAAGREILVTSTAALAAERLAGELTENRVDCRAFSTAALANAIKHDRVALTPQTTIIHDGAALASTREQLDLLDAVETTGARLIAVGDPEQNQPVGAGGLWHHIETATRDADAHVELTHNQRAHHPADRRDQARFRQGEIELAIRGYAARDHIHLSDDTRRAEDRALEAAQRDRAAGKTTTVIAQTSNDHLDALNARAQAIRLQAGELDDDSVPVPGRPYELHERDAVQIRHTIQHPAHGPLRNGTAATITALDSSTGALWLRLADGIKVTLGEREIADSDLRLAYVQHPFPAQGQTTDTTHLVIGDHATQEGTYVGLTRARASTDIYAATPSAFPATANGSSASPTP